MMARPKIILLWQPARRRKIMRSSHAIVCALLAAGLGAHAAAAAESWPTRPLTMVVPFAAGGGTDVMGRIVGRRLSEVLGQQVIIENVGGAGGMVGSARVAKAAPDGYTFVLGSRADAINQTLYKNPLYNLATDLAPVNAAMGVSIAHVPYRGGGPAMQDLIAGRIDYFCTLSGTVASQIEGKLVKPIANLSRERSPMLPALATAQEQGLKDFDASTWFGFFVPQNTPAAVIQKLHDATVEAMDTPSVQERLKEVGAMTVAPDRRSPAYLQQFVASEIEKNAAPLRAAGIAMD
jgi:tripartite-type tricarboxylate transporter receptor subunit TctC